MSSDYVETQQEDFYRPGTLAVDQSTASKHGSGE